MTSWREDAKLRGRFHPDFPDDLQVIAHDGHPNISGHGAELIWVRVTGVMNQEYTGIVLNCPVHLVTVAQGEEIQFIVPEGGPFPLQVTRDYLAQRNSWRLLAPCQNCGLTELLSPPRDLALRSGLNPPDGLHGGYNFTTKCGWCGGNQVVRIKRARTNA